MRYHTFIVTIEYGDLDARDTFTLPLPSVTGNLDDTDGDAQIRRICSTPTGLRPIYAQPRIQHPKSRTTGCGGTGPAILGRCLQGLTGAGGRNPEENGLTPLPVHAPTIKEAEPAKPPDNQAGPRLGPAF